MLPSASSKSSIGFKNQGVYLRTVSFLESQAYSYSQPSSKSNTTLPLCIHFLHRFIIGLIRIGSVIGHVIDPPIVAKSFDLCIASTGWDACGLGDCWLAGLFGPAVDSSAGRVERGGLSIGVASTVGVGGVGRGLKRAVVLGRHNDCLGRCQWRSVASMPGVFLLLRKVSGRRNARNVSGTIYASVRD